MVKRFLAVIGIALVLFAEPVSAQQYPPAPGGITASRTAVAQCESITVRASGYSPGATVDFTLRSNPVGLGSSAANGDGVATMVLNIPCNTTAGLHTITARGQSANGERAQTLTISVGGRGGAAASGGGALPQTGSDHVTPLTIVGGALLAAGAAALVVAHRRRRLA